MSDILGKIVVIILAGVLLFITPVTIYSLKQNNNIETYVVEATNRFVDKSRSTGFVSPNNYLEFIEKLDNTGLVYDINITHDSKACDPVYNLSGNPTGDYNTNYRAYYKTEILTTLFPDNNLGAMAEGRKYSLKNGDFFNVSVINKNPTLGMILYSFFSKTMRNGGEIMANHGGFVGNEQQ